MKRLVSFVVEDDPEQFVVVEVDAPPETGEEPAARRGEIQRAEQSLHEALDRVQPAASALIAKILALPEPPHETTVEFGINLTAKAGAVLASAGVEANYKVTLTWRRP